MKFIVNRSDLNNAISTVIRAVATKSSISALESILVEADEHGVRLTGYNLKTGIRVALPDAAVKDSGRVCLPAKMFADIVRRMEGEDVTLQASDGLCTVRCGRAKAKFSCINAEEFPDLPEVPETGRIELPQNSLRDMIERTVFAASTNDSRPIHTGELFEVARGNLTVVAVDGYRLALRKEAVTEGEDTKFVVPAAALVEVARICKTEEPIEIYPGENHILFRTDSTVVVSRRLTGVFLDYKKAIPKGNPNVVTVKRVDLLNSINRCALVINEKVKTALICAFTDGNVNMSAKTAIGEVVDDCPVEGNIFLRIGFNHRYLTEALKAADADEVKLEMDKPINACLITPADEKDTGKFLHMVLPVRIR